MNSQSAQGVPKEPRRDLGRIARRVASHLTRRAALLSACLVGLAVWVVSLVGSDSAVGQGALVVIGTLISFVLLPEEPHRLWNVDAQSLADTVPPAKLAFAGRELTKALAIQSANSAPAELLIGVWDASQTAIERMAADPSLVVKDLDYRVVVSPGPGESRVLADIKAERYFDGREEIAVSFCSDLDAMAHEFTNDGCVLREMVERRFEESVTEWVDRVRNYPVSVHVGGRPLEKRRVESKTVGNEDSAIFRSIFTLEARTVGFELMRVVATWETNDSSFPIRFSSYSCVGSTTVSFEVKDKACRIDYNEFFSAVDRPMRPERSATLDAQRVTISAPKGTVLPPGSGAVFTWTGRRTPLLGQIPAMEAVDLPVGDPITRVGPVPKTRRPAKSSPDALVPVAGLRLVDAYALLGILPPREMLVRTSVLERLAAASRELPEGFELVVLDAWRSLDVQHQLHEHYGSVAVAGGYVAATSPDGMRPPHVTGGAVDVTLGFRGVPLAVGSDYDDFGGSAHLTAYEGVEGVPRRLRRILAKAMLAAGFAPYPLEWWHWSYGDDVWAEFVGADEVIYETMESM